MDPKTPIKHEIDGYTFECVADLSEKIKVSNDIPAFRFELAPYKKIAKAVSHFISWHAMCVHKELPKFNGYDTIDFEFDNESVSVSFGVIFRYAEAKFGISWNQANDLFFGTEVLRYKSFDSFEAIEGELETITEDMEDYEKALEIIQYYMRENNIGELMVLND